MMTGAYSLSGYVEVLLSSPVRSAPARRKIFIPGGDVQNITSNLESNKRCSGDGGKKRGSGVAMALADNIGNSGGRERWWKQRHWQEQTTINQKAAAIVAEMVVLAAEATAAAAAGAKGAAVAAAMTATTSTATQTATAVAVAVEARQPWKWQ